MLGYLVFFSAVLQFLGSLAYVRGILRGQAKPNRVTWITWAIAPLIATAAAVSKGVGWAVLPVFMTGFGPVMILTTSFFRKSSYWRLGFFDYLCGIFSALALALWQATGEPNVAIAFAVISDVFAAVPTLKKSWQQPATEVPYGYAAAIFGACASLAAIKTWNFAGYAFPIYLILVNAVLVFAIYRQKIFPSYFAI